MIFIYFLRKKNMAKRLLSRYLCILSCMLSITTIAANEVKDQLAKRDQSVFELFRDIPANQLQIVEDTFTLPNNIAQTKWTSFDAGLSSKNNQFFIALDTLSRGKNDGIFRYTVKIVTARGVENRRFEGVDCLLRVYKVYAFGNDDGSWAKATTPLWHHIERHVRNDYHATLFDTMCRSSSTQSIEKIRRQFLRGDRYDFIP